MQKAAVDSVTLSMASRSNVKSFIFSENGFYKGDTTECLGDNITVSLAPFSAKKCLSLLFRKLLRFCQQQIYISKATGAVV